MCTCVHIPSGHAHVIGKEKEIYFTGLAPIIMEAGKPTVCSVRCGRASVAVLVQRLAGWRTRRARVKMASKRSLLENSPLLGVAGRFGLWRPSPRNLHYGERSALFKVTDLNVNSTSRHSKMTHKINRYSRLFPNGWTADATFISCWILLGVMRGLFWDFRSFFIVLLLVHPPVPHCYLSFFSVW